MGHQNRSLKHYKRLRMICPKIIGVHCVAHREALAAKDGFTTNQPIFDAIDKLAQKIKSWLGKSSLRHKELKELLQSYCLKELKMLAMHDVRWLSRGEVMQWLVIAMPALLDQWKIADKTQYSSLTTIQPVEVKNTRMSSEPAQSSSVVPLGLDLNALGTALLPAPTPGSVADCVIKGQAYVQATVNTLNTCFPDVTFFNSFKLFRPVS
ncbi:uncharacterized protein LOC9637723 [Selaginella moellendorffii]|uniref:uncharacterized protein LOC9637723 n=1 Tax=Selaginella moellendorffii TaxID=88036 RepID=UPI000D1C68BB|nr:uncharacterized protein LOC9637723 [Selaginella moellendorffii]|eukprot:XP_024535893.1 uncharacterized protein LOC9637723 [Selaginella moellendorffii]